MYDLNILEDFRIELKEELTQEDRHKLLLVLFSYGFFWVAGVKDELSRVKNLVYVANIQIYHSNDEYSPWKNFPLITYEEIINGC